MVSAAQITTPCVIVWNSKSHTYFHDVRFRHLDERCNDASVPESLVCKLLCGVERIHELRTTVWIDEVIACVHPRCDELRSFGYCDTGRDRQHDRVAVRHDGLLHRLLGVMSFWNLGLRVHQYAT